MKMDQHTGPTRSAQNRPGSASGAGNGTSELDARDAALVDALRRAYARRNRPYSNLPEYKKKRVASAYVEEYRRKREIAAGQLEQ